MDGHPQRGSSRHSEGPSSASVPSRAVPGPRDRSPEPETGAEKANSSHDRRPSNKASWDHHRSPPVSATAGTPIGLRDSRGCRGARPGAARTWGVRLEILSTLEVSMGVRGEERRGGCRHPMQVHPGQGQLRRVQAGGGKARPSVSLHTLGTGTSAAPLWRRLPGSVPDLNSVYGGRG
jgi:hypothetical protein